MPVVGDLLDRALRAVVAGSAGGCDATARRAGCGEAGGRPDVLQRQIEREGAADARRAAQLDFAAEQVGQLAADGEARGRCRRTCGWCRRRPAGTPRR